MYTLRSAGRKNEGRTNDGVQIKKKTDSAEMSFSTVSLERFTRTLGRRDHFARVDRTINNNKYSERF